MGSIPRGRPPLQPWAQIQDIYDNLAYALSSTGKDIQAFYTPTPYKHDLPSGWSVDSPYGKDVYRQAFNSFNPDEQEYLKTVAPNMNLNYAHSNPYAQGQTVSGSASAFPMQGLSMRLGHLLYPPNVSVRFPSYAGENIQQSHMGLHPTDPTKIATHELSHILIDNALAGDTSGLAQRTQDAFSQAAHVNPFLEQAVIHGHGGAGPLFRDNTYMPALDTSKADVLRSQAGDLANAVDRYRAPSALSEYLASLYEFGGQPTRMPLKGKGFDFSNLTDQIRSLIRYQMQGP